MSTTEVADPYGLMTRQFQVDPYPTYARLRDEAPAYFSEGWGGWILTRYQDVQAGFKDTRRMSSNRAGAFGALLPAALKERLAPVVRSLSSWALLIDPPDHTRIRSLVNKAFTPRLVEYLRPRIQELVDGMLDKAEASGRLDVVQDLANILPVSVIGEMLGIPREDSVKLTVWSNAFATFFGTAKYTPEVLDQMRTGIVEMEDYFRGVIAQRRKSATVGNDLLSTMMAAEDQGNILSEQEALATCSLVLFAGHETTTHLLTNGLYLLLKHPEQRGLMEGTDEQLTTAVEEILRYESPIQRLSRVITEDFELHGQTLKKGQKAFVMIGAANRDPLQFPKAEQLDLQRQDNRHIAFGFSIHYCLGAALARLEGQIALRTVLRRFPNMKLLQEPERLENVAFRGFKSMPVSLG
ncbi:cytochrome P450 [Hyalangium rubrum]|uniref:Cytochrome P450 n=1 Tax=Hyalangium rubrum TaxID=3103134 RepID=A0ABU5GXX2_9BACT|nr:cytochrome P450 [Hyalangium sp. s54d21]MDY7226043.1 cytochrome P450 [Hyalangium sp. s54d21]